MKYTNYIIKGNVVDLEQLIPEKPFAKQLVILGLLPVAFMGVLFIGGTIPGALLIDGYRSIKMRYYLYMKRYRIYKYYDEAFSSLSISVHSKERIKLILTKGKKSILDSSAVSLSESPISTKLRIQYALIKSSYLLTDGQLKVINILGKGVNLGIGAASKSWSALSMRDR
ncbi:MAG TPA: hypothetical protein PLP47_04655 [Methanofastidiosum sp.]|jgi:hypothetical protein|nr:hypothetical protein [Methanofastidiosum sp.]